MMHSVPSVLAKNPQASAAWLNLCPFLNQLGDVSIREKATCIHVDAAGAAFLGVHPRKSGVRLTIVLAHALESERIVKCEAVSKSRYHNEVDFLEGPLDDELKAWIEEAYKLRVLKGVLTEAVSRRWSRTIPTLWKGCQCCSE